MPSLIPLLYKYLNFLQDVSKLSVFCVFEPNTSSNHEDACQNDDLVQESSDSSTVSPGCDSVCSDTEQHSASTLYPQISSVCTVLKKEIEINEMSAFNGVADHPEFQELKEENIVTPDTENEGPYGLQTPLKKCSVQLVDCGKILKQVTKSTTASRECKFAYTITFHFNDICSFLCV